MAMLCGHLVIIALVKTHHHMMLSSPVKIKKRNNAVVTILLTSELFRSSRLTSNRPTRHSLRHKKASLYAVIALLSFMGMSLDSSHSPLLVSPGQSKPLSYSQRLPLHACTVQSRRTKITDIFAMPCSQRHCSARRYKSSSLN
jgi:hypothetical protein